VTVPKAENIITPTGDTLRRKPVLGDPAPFGGHRSIERAVQRRAVALGVGHQVASSA